MGMRNLQFIVIIFYFSSCSSAGGKVLWNIEAIYEENEYFLNCQIKNNSNEDVSFDLKSFLNNCMSREEVAPTSFRQDFGFTYDQVVLEDDQGVLRTISTFFVCPGESKAMSYDDCFTLTPEPVFIEAKESGQFIVSFDYLSDIMANCSTKKVRFHYVERAGTVVCTSNWINILSINN